MMSDLRSRSSNAPRRPDGLDYAALFGFAAGILLAWWLVVGCSPSAAQEQGRAALYGLALQGCIYRAQHGDAGYAGYEACARDVDALSGRADGGAP